MNINEKYNIAVDEFILCEKINKIRKRADGIKDKDILRHIFSLIDLTRLNTSDTEESIKTMTEKVNRINTRFPDLRNVSAICVYPVFVNIVKSNLTDENVKIASVAAGFPSSQTYTEVKLKEVERIIEDGADEIDIVIPLGKYLSGNYDYVSHEIKSIKEKCGTKTLKVILETGEMPDLSSIKHASYLVMEAGADFLKTSTGKASVNSTPEALYIMCEAIKDFYNHTGKKTGIKPAGGVSDSFTAILYYLIVSEILGNGWLNSKLFRFGASKLADNLLGENYFI